jgi:hypothetical protein
MRGEVISNSRGCVMVLDGQACEVHLGYDAKYREH